MLSKSKLTNQITVEQFNIQDTFPAGLQAFT